MLLNLFPTFFTSDFINLTSKNDFNSKIKKIIDGNMEII